MAHSKMAPPCKEPQRIRYIDSINPPLPRKVHALIPGDIHLGDRHNRARTLLELLLIAYFKCGLQVLVLQGDTLHHLNLEKLIGLKRRRSRLRGVELRVLWCIEFLRTQGVRVIYMQGNHDPDIRGFLRKVHERLTETDAKKRSREYRALEALALIERWEIRKDHVVLTYGEEKIFINHGHQYDHVTSKRHFLTGTGTIAYTVIKELDPSHRLAEASKEFAKKVFSINDRVAQGTVESAHKHGARVGVAGHTHKLVVGVYDVHDTVVTHLNAGGFDLPHSGCVAITPEGVATVHCINTRLIPSRKGPYIDELVR